MNHTKGISSGLIEWESRLIASPAVTAARRFYVLPSDTVYYRGSSYVSLWLQ